MPQTLLTQRSFDIYRNKGVMYISTYVKLSGGFDTAKWGGYEYNTLFKKGRTRYKVNHYDHRYFHIKYSVFQNDMFFRFVTPFYTHDDLKAGALKKYMLATYHPNEKGEMIEEIVYWRPNSPTERKWSDGIIRKFNMTSDNAQDYLFYVRRGSNPPFKYDFRLVYREVDLPRIDHECYSTRTIKKNLTGNKCDFLEMPKITRHRLSKWDDDRTRTVVEMMVETLIPSERHRPTKEKYIFWFQRYGKLSDYDAEKCYTHRAHVGLP